jgi:DUF971 family protein
MSAQAADVWPSELRLSPDKRQLTVSFEDGARFELGAEYLRVMSPSAEVQGHGAHDKRIQAGKIDVAVAALEPVGRYAVRIVFDDGHDTGLYTWRYLHELGTTYDVAWPRYIAELAHHGLSRHR